MWKFAWKNLLTRPMRTSLAIVGLSVAILGIVGLFSASASMEELVHSSLDQIKGIVLVYKNSLHPVLSTLPVSVGEKVRRIPGVTLVTGEIWRVAYTVEGQGTLNRGILQDRAIFGIDIPSRIELNDRVYSKHVVAGRFLDRSDIGSNHCLISQTVAAEYQKRVGDPLSVNDKPMKVVGIYATGTAPFDIAIIMDIGIARTLASMPKGSVSSFYVEVADPSPEGIRRMVRKLDAALEAEHVEARGTDEWTRDFSLMLRRLDIFFVLVTSLALVVGVTGILNTMLMSVTERFAEFGILRANGWSRLDVLRLIAFEAGYVGLLSGVLGSFLGAVAARAASHFLPITLVTPARLLLMGVALAFSLGIIGGIYPAYRAAGMAPMEAIRRG